MSQSIEEKVISFCARELSINKKTIKQETTLLGDLKIYGDDADDFFCKFAEEFKVDLSGLDLSKYFPSEPSMHPETLLWLLRRMLLKGTLEQKANKKPITVRHLIEVAKIGKWIDP